MQIFSDAGVLAKARKFPVIDYLPANAVLKKTGLDLITPPSPLASPQSCFNLFTFDSGFPSLDEGSNISIHSDHSRGSVDSYLPSFYEGGSTSVAPLSSDRGISPSELQVFISREKPEIISDLFASHSSVMQSGSSGVVSLVRK
jgi:hypothetical protein